MYCEFYLIENGLEHPVKRNQNCSLLQRTRRKGSGRGNICSLSTVTQKGQAQNIKKTVIQCNYKKISHTLFCTEENNNLETARGAN